MKIVSVEKKTRSCCEVSEKSNQIIQWHKLGGGMNVQQKVASKGEKGKIKHQANLTIIIIFSC